MVSGWAPNNSNSNNNNQLRPPRHPTLQLGAHPDTIAPTQRPPFPPKHQGSSTPPPPSITGQLPPRINTTEALGPMATTTGLDSNRPPNSPSIMATNSNSSRLTKQHLLLPQPLLHLLPQHPQAPPQLRQPPRVEVLPH